MSLHLFNKIAFVQAFIVKQRDKLQQFIVLLIVCTIARDNSLSRYVSCHIWYGEACTPFESYWCVQYTVAFCCQAIHKKILLRFDTSFDIQTMMKIYVIEIIFKSHKPFQSYQLTEFSQKGWLGWASQLGTLKGLVRSENNSNGIYFHRHF